MIESTIEVLSSVPSEASVRLVPPSALNKSASNSRIAPDKVLAVVVSVEAPCFRSNSLIAKTTLVAVVVMLSILPISPCNSTIPVAAVVAEYPARLLIVLWSPSSALSSLKAADISVAERPVKVILPISASCSFIASLTFCAVVVNV